MNTLKKGTQTGRRIARVRAKISGTEKRPRLAVKRSLKHVYVQLIDDASGKTIAAAQDADIEAKELKGKKKSEVAAMVGKLLAERAKEKGVTAVVFDRRDKRFHGRVKAVADGAREGGLQF
jgi:large subunit ribosomal protein L18